MFEEPLISPCSSFNLAHDFVGFIKPILTSQILRIFMYTIKEIAEQIELTKPDFKQFLELANSRNSAIFADVTATTNIFSKILKAEILLMLSQTHNYGYYFGNKKECFDIISSNVSNHGLNGSINYNAYNRYYVDKNFDNTCHILGNIKDPKPYLPTYLWNRVKAKKISTETLKQLQPNQMSLQIFKTYLQGLKKNLSSIEVENYLKQLKDSSFEAIREDFMDVLFSKCPKPSIDLQKQLAGNVWNSQMLVVPDQENDVLYKYMTLSRKRVKQLADRLQVPVSQSVFDTLDSAYKPFITGIYRTPDTSINELSYLFSALLLFQISILETPNPVYSYFIECLTKHLQAPESVAAIRILKQQHLLFNQAVAQLQL